MTKLSIAVQIAWKIAAREADAARFRFIEKEHMLLGIISIGDEFDSKSGPIRMLPENQKKKLNDEWSFIDQKLADCPINSTSLRRYLRRALGIKRYRRTGVTIHRSPACKECFDFAGRLAGTDGVVSAQLLMAALLENPGDLLTQVLREFSTTPVALKTLILPQNAEDDWSDVFVPAEQNQPESQPESLLEQFGKNLTKLARENKLSPIFGRRDELLQVVQVLARASKNNPVLLGDPGVGKTAIVEALAVRIAEKNCAQFLHGFQIIEINMGQLIAGTAHRGEFEERVSGIIEEVMRQKETILFIDEMHTLAGDAAQMLKPALARGDFRCIGSTTYNEYHHHIESDPALERRFDKVIVNEPSPQDCLEMLRGLRPVLEKHHNCRIDEGAIKSAVDLSIRFDQNHRLPDKAIDLLDLAGARIQAPCLSLRGRQEETAIQTIDAEMVADVLATKLAIPKEILVGQGNGVFIQRLQGMAERLKQRVVGQDAAIDAVLQHLNVALCHLTPRKGPLGVFLFLGPSGVGKTELAKSLAVELFGKEESLIRFDMSEYQERYSVSKLIGSPPGYVDSDKEGLLTGKLRKTPFSILLLDEAEKAHPKIYDVFLQLFDEGRITDSQGRTVDAGSTIVILTSNIKPAAKVGAIGFVPQKALSTTNEIPELRQFFRTELLNRIDESILFRPLAREDMARILDLYLEDICQGLNKKHGITMRISPEVKGLLTEKGFDPEFGARELRRTVSRLLEQKLAQRLLYVEKATSIWEANVQAGEISIEAVQPKTANHNHLAVVKELFEAEGRILKISQKKGNLVVVGDLHNDLKILNLVLDRLFYPHPDNLMLFLGDYVDRTPESIKDNKSAVVDKLLSLKKQYPERIFMLLGNHDLDPEQYVGFHSSFWNEQIEDRQDFYKETLSAMPIVAVTANGVAMCHGVLPHMKDFQRFDLTTRVWRDVLWSDYYEDGQQRAYSTRGSKAKNDFIDAMDSFGSLVLIKGHNPNAPLTMFDKKCITLQTNRHYMHKCGINVAIIKLQNKIKSSNDVKLLDLEGIINYDPDKYVLAELKETFFASGKRYDMYSFGKIEYSNGKYKIIPTDTDDAHSKSHKFSVLKKILSQKIIISRESLDKVVTKDDDTFLEMYADRYTNMYGGLFIIKSSGDSE